MVPFLSLNDVGWGRNRTSIDKRNSLGRIVSARRDQKGFEFRILLMILLRAGPHRDAARVLRRTGRRFGQKALVVKPLESR